MSPLKYRTLCFKKPSRVDILVFNQKYTQERLNGRLPHVMGTQPHASTMPPNAYRVPRLGWRWEDFGSKYGFCVVTIH